MNKEIKRELLLAMMTISACITDQQLLRFVLRDSPPKLPETDWSSGNNHSTSSIDPVTVKFTQEAIDDLKYRLKHTRTPYPSIIGSAWNYGINGESVKKAIDYWLNDYDFGQRQDHLNQFPHFRTNIQVPLLMLHGYPGSIVEFYRIIPMLTSPKPVYDFVFEVVAPSLPGFGLSEGTLKPGLGSGQMAVIMKNLMLRLGFDKFYTQGGDAGAFVAQDMAIMFPDHVQGMHSNFCSSLLPKTLLKYGLSFFLHFAAMEEPLLLSTDVFNFIRDLGNR